MSRDQLNGSRFPHFLVEFGVASTVGCKLGDIRDGTKIRNSKIIRKACVYGDNALRKSGYHHTVLAWQS